jgi:hypothetical protein
VFSEGLVRPERFELPTPCFVGTLTLSIPYLPCFPFHSLTPIRGFCFRSKLNPFPAHDIDFWHTSGTHRRDSTRAGLPRPPAPELRLSLRSNPFCRPSASPSAGSNTLKPIYDRCPTGLVLIPEEDRRGEDPLKALNDATVEVTFLRRPIRRLSGLCLLDRPQAVGQWTGRRLFGRNP